MLNSLNARLEVSNRRCGSINCLRKCSGIGRVLIIKADSTRCIWPDRDELPEIAKLCVLFDIRKAKVPEVDVVPIEVAEPEVSEFEVAEIKIAGIELAGIEVDAIEVVEIARFSLARTGRGDSGNRRCSGICCLKGQQRGMRLRRTR